MIYYAYKDSSDPLFKEFDLLSEEGKYLGSGNLREFRVIYGVSTIYKGIPKDMVLPSNIKVLLDEQGNILPTYRLYWFKT